MRKQKHTAQRCCCSIFPNNGSERTAKRYPDSAAADTAEPWSRQCRTEAENGALPFCLKTCSPPFGVRTTERSSVMSEWKPPAYQRGRFSRCMKMFAAETACQAHAVIYLPIPSAAPFYGIDAAKQQREERNRSSLCCLPHFFRSAFCSALRCFFAIRSAFFCSFAACHSFFC